MTTRRDQRPTHVRPRPPSTGRPAPVKVKPQAPGPTRLSSHRPIKHHRDLPIIARLGLIAAIGLLGVGVVYLGIGGLSTLVGGVGTALGGFVDQITATPTPKPSVVSMSDAPALQQPSEPYTSDPNVDLIVTVPKGLAGDPDQRIRVYLALADQAAVAIQDAPLADATTTIIPVELTKGINDFSVTIVGPAGQSDPSAVVRYVLDQQPPKITVTSPKNGGVVNRTAVTIKGKTQARTTLLARNESNGSSIAATAEADGTFSLSLALANGVNKITISGTDPAGNVSEASLSVRRGTGKLSVALSASAYTIKVDKLPEAIVLSATLTDPDGKPLPDVDITFTLSVPGIPTVTSDGKTDKNGKATFETTIPKGVDIGQGSASVLASSSEFGSTEDFTVITIQK